MNKQITKLTLNELQKELEKTEKRMFDLQAAIELKLEEDKTSLAEEIKQLIENRGYQQNDIVTLISPRRKAYARRTSRKSASVYVDPENPDNVYKGRGPLPRWVKEKMKQLGLDPANKEDRQRLLAEMLQS